MYSVAVNIVVEYNGDKLTINDIPYLLCNDRLLPIIYQIRKIITDNFKTYATELQVPLYCFKFGLSIFDSEHKIFKMFNIDCKNIRELRLIMSEEYPIEIYEKILKII